MMWAWKFCLCRRHSDYEEEEGTMIENFMGPQNLAEEWLLCETNLKSFWYFMIMTYKCVSHHRAHNKWWKTQPTSSTLRSHFEKGNLTTSLCPLMQAFIKKVFSRMSFNIQINVFVIWQHFCVHYCKRSYMESFHLCLYHSNQFWLLSYLFFRSGQFDITLSWLEFLG